MKKGYIVPHPTSASTIDLLAKFRKEVVLCKEIIQIGEETLDLKGAFKELTEIEIAYLCLAIIEASNPLGFY